MSLSSLMTKMMCKKGADIKKELELISLDPKEEQEKFLFKILDKAKDTEFGLKYDLASINSIDEFKKRIPLMEYDDYAPYIERMVKGEKNVLTTEKIVHFNLTSGTLGAPKMIPITEEHVQIFGRYNAKYLNHLISEKVGLSWVDKKGFSLAEGTYKILPTGVSIGCASSIMAARMGRMIPFLKFDFCKNLFTSPIEARQPGPGTPTRYLHARFALMDKNISYSNATFSSYLLEIMRYIEDHHKELVEDIRKGTINDNVSVPEEVMKTLKKKIKPMPKRADELEKIFSEGFKAEDPIAKKIWPKLSYVICVGGAGFSQYTEKLKERYLGYDLDFVFLGVSSSEGYFSLPIAINDTSSILVPNSVFMEFIPIENESSETLLMHELEIGKEYELVISTINGLFRYRMKDVFKVTGFHNKTPMIEFSSRKGNAINMFGEKTSEKALLKTVQETCKTFNLDLYDYAFYPNNDDSLGHYTMLLEVRNDVLPNKEEVTKEAEKQLALANEDMGEVIKDKICGPLDMKFLQRETFLLYKDLLVYKGRSAAQLKPIHVLTPVNKKFFFKLEEE